MTPTQRYIHAIARGEGTPFKWLRLRDIRTGEMTDAMYLGAIPRADDGCFYAWAWEDTRLRLVLPPMSHWIKRKLGWWLRSSRTMLQGKTIDGRWVGPFEIEEGT